MSPTRKPGEAVGEKDREPARIEGRFTGIRPVMEPIRHIETHLSLASPTGAPPGPVWLHLLLIAFAVGILITSLRRHH